MDDTAAVIFNDMAAFKGYAYLLVTKGNGCLCTVLFDNFSSIHTNLARLRKYFQICIVLRYKNLKNLVV
jgi:hypothetical protein